MIRGTTPTHTFELPVDRAVISKLRVLYAQNGKLLLTKTEADCSIEGSSATVKLSQEDTLTFNASSLVDVQVRIRTVGNDAIASDIYHVSCAALLENEVI